ncbi:MAG: hypothetical protein BGO67_10800 [Alphaproteobacteria bacterium 41-28]|nr:MAG: hypothetical protein BGO67_10800 [Alphaproteobacteria bacterium 41-28]
MNRYKIILLTGLAVFALSMGVKSVSTVEVQNKTGENIQVFFRGIGSLKPPYIVTLAPNTAGEYEIIDEYIEGKPVYEAIASTGSGGNPDWKFLGGTCSPLYKDKNHIIRIEPTLAGLKTSCTTLK